MNAIMDNEIHLKLLRLLKGNPKITQRQMNSKMGVSVGKINYCLSALSEKGMIKVERFKKATNKTAYMYRLTPLGMEEIGRLTISFLKLKISEYSQIKEEIKSLYGQIDKNDLASCNDPEFLADLEKLV